MKAITILKENKSVKEKAESFVKSAKTYCTVEVLEKARARVTQIEDQIADLENSLSVTTDFNAGVIEKTREYTKQTFATIIKKEVELVLAQKELEATEVSFNKYFGDGKK